MYIFSEQKTGYKKEQIAYRKVRFMFGLKVFRYRYCKRGMMLITILMLVFLLVMLTTSMITLTSETLNLTGNMDKKTRALQAAEAGIDYAFYQLNNDNTWGDPNVSALFLSDIAESLDNNQNFTIIFDQTRSSYSKNNLYNPAVNGSTPAYGAEIICEGNYRGYKETSRAIFLREELIPYPLVTGGYINMKCGWMGNGQYFKIRGKDVADPGRIHGNKNMELYGNDTPVLDMGDGFLSLGETLTRNFRVIGQIKTKENLDTPIRIPDISAQNIINNRGICLDVNSGKIYLLGYFEHKFIAPGDPGNYAIPHCSYLNEALVWNKTVKEYPYKLGIVVINENNIQDFMDCYINMYASMDFNYLKLRNFYTDYPDLEFWDATDADFNTKLMNNLGMTFTVDGGNPDYLTLNLTKDLFVSGVNGLFATGTIIEINYQRGGFVDTESKLNFAGHNIYGNMFIGIPPVGEGSIISTEIIDMLHSHTLDEMLLVSDKSVRIAYQATASNGIANYSGIIYAKDDIFIQTSGQDNNQEFHFFGTIACKNVNPSSSPSCSPYSVLPVFSFYRDNATNFYLCPWMLNEVSITHTDDGLDKLITMRGNDFKIRKQYMEILK